MVRERRKVKHYSLLFLSLLMLGVLIYTIELEVFADYLLRLSPNVILSVVAIYGIAWLVRAFRLYLLVPGGLKLEDAFRIQVAGFALNLIYPAKLGEVFMGSFLKEKMKIRFQKSLAYILHLRVLDFLILFILGAFSLAFLPGKSLSRELWIVIAGGGVAAVVLGSILFLSCHPRFLGMIAGILPGRFNFTRLLTYLAQFHRMDRVYFLSLLASLLIWGLEVYTCYIISMQIAPEVGIWAVLSALAFGNILKALPLFPGGLGTFEAGFILILTLHGAPYGIAVALSIIDHLLKKLLNLLVGFPVYLSLQKSSFRVHTSQH